MKLGHLIERLVLFVVVVLLAGAAIVIAQANREVNRLQQGVNEACEIRSEQIQVAIEVWQRQVESEATNHTPGIGAIKDARIEAWNYGINHYRALPDPCARLKEATALESAR